MLSASSVLRWFNRLSEAGEAGRPDATFSRKTSVAVLGMRWLFSQNLAHKNKKPTVWRWDFG